MNLVGRRIIVATLIGVMAAGGVLAAFGLALTLTRALMWMAANFGPELASVTAVGALFFVLAFLLFFFLADDADVRAWRLWRRI